MFSFYIVIIIIIIIIIIGNLFDVLFHTKITKYYTTHNLNLSAAYYVAPPAIWAENDVCYYKKKKINGPSDVLTSLISAFRQLTHLSRPLILKWLRS